MKERMILVTFRCPRVGEVINDSGVRYRVKRIIRWTGTVAELAVEGLVSQPEPQGAGHNKKEQQGCL